MKQVKEVSERKRGRPRRGAEQNSADILDAALQTFARHGFEQTSLRTIAAAAGVDVALISYRYGSKLDLWKAIVSEVASETVELLEDGIARSQSIDQADRMDHVWSEAIEVIWRRPQFSQIMFLEITANRDEERRAFIAEALAKPFFELLYPFMQSSLSASARAVPFDTKLGMIASIALAGLLSSTRDFMGQFTDIARQDDLLRQQVKLLVRTIWAEPNIALSRPEHEARPIRGS